VDLICLLTLIIIAFVVESKKLFLFIKSLPIGGGQTRFNVLFLIILIFLISSIAFYFLFKRSKRVNAFVVKMWKGFREGLLSIFRLENKALFIFYSLIIWALYFIMSYTVIQAFPETNHLGATAVLSLFAIGSIAMAAPLPGGTGSYHVLVPQGLVFLYHVPQANAVAFTFIFHGWQTSLMIVLGAISLIITSVIVRRKSAIKEKQLL
jgi:glycosyltransferase 2 family protein